MSAAAVLDLVRTAERAGVTLEARLWADNPDRLAPELRDALASARPAVLRLLLDRQAAAALAEGTGAAAPTPPVAAPALPPRAGEAEPGGRHARLQALAQRRPPSSPMIPPPGGAGLPLLMLCRADVVVRTGRAAGLALHDLLSA